MFVILFSGGYYLESSVTWILRWLQYISASYYGRCALANNQYDDYIINPTLDGDEVLKDKFAVGLGLWGSIGALMGLIVIFFVCSLIIFHYNIKQNINRIKRKVN